MRYIILACLIMPAAAQAQALQTSPERTRIADQAKVEISSPSLNGAAATGANTDVNNVAKPLAQGKEDAPLLSDNEKYNLSRARQGRLGIRLGNDVGLRVTDR